ncbi:hypothetical protein Micbo1qcDRAFT_226888 [Microdochium bolleyi]|uniref:Uncharacterized protein n=1 Tax=Microdochium bolleyi TaxID=196109 RepID=A0A136IJ78_9PEZI|nr:hypothetical protein Micbo1qcDRAFT_226888 [Microdochium bolleyi]
MDQLHFKPMKPLSFAERALLHEHNEFLSQMNDEAKVRRSTKSEILGTARVMSYEDLEKARADRAAEKAANEARRVARETRKAAPNSIKSATSRSIRSRGRRRKSIVRGTYVPYHEEALQAELAGQDLGVLDLKMLAGLPFGGEAVPHEIVRSPQRAPIAPMF